MLLLCIFHTFLIVQTVPAASVTALAKPIKEQKVDKEKVWLIFILGAAGLFGGTLLLENNERFFPAIYKANLAMSQAKKAMKVSGMHFGTAIHLVVLLHAYIVEHISLQHTGTHDCQMGLTPVTA